MKIAIYSGSIPSTTFIENLIRGIGENKKVLLFGTINSKIKYGSKNIRIVRTPRNQWLNFLLTTFRFFKLIFKSPNLTFIAINEALKYKTPYEKWMRFSRFVPVLLFQPDIFHLQWAKKIDRWMFLKEAYNCKIVISLRGAHINYTPVVYPEIERIYKKYFPLIDGFHAVSQAIANEAIRYGASPEKTKVIHSPIEKSIFEHFDINKKFRNIKNDINICCVGRFHWKKGYSYALNAINELNKKGVSSKLTIIATNEIDDEVLFLINDLKLKEQVKIIGGMDQNLLISHMKSYDLLLLPSVEEGIANVVLEAMAIGLPVVSTDCGGMSEVVIDKETGWLVPVRDPGMISVAIIDFSKRSEEELKNFTVRAHNLVKNRFNAEDSIKQFLKFYESLI